LYGRGTASVHGQGGEENPHPESPRQWRCPHQLGEGDPQTGGDLRDWVGRSVIAGNPTCPPRLAVLSPPEQVARLNGEKWQGVLEPTSPIIRNPKSRKATKDATSPIITDSVPSIGFERCTFDLAAHAHTISEIRNAKFEIGHESFRIGVQSAIANRKSAMR